ncbi:MAG: efflux RND transporter periplasmic adaptor subunit [Candidatus Methylumidiphilus sp.]
MSTVQEEVWEVLRKLALSSEETDWGLVMNRMWKMTRNHFLPRAALFILTGLFLAACAKEIPQPVKKPLARVEGERVEFADPKTMPALLSLVQVQSETERKARISGRMAWDEERTVRVRSPFAGKVAEIFVQPGTKVSRGQTLATVFAPDFGAAQADLRRDEAEFTRKRKSLERVRELHDHGVVPHKELDEAEADFDEARSEFERAQTRLKMYGTVGGGVDERFALKSPLGGVVVLKNINPGQEIQADANGAPLFVITDPSSLWVLLDASENDLAGIDPGESFTLSTKLYPGQSFAGVVEHIADNVDVDTRTVKIRGRVSNQQHKLKADMFVSAEVELPPVRHPLVPPKALVMAGSESYVFVGESDAVFIRRKVQAGLEERGMVPVVSGLAPGEKVVVDGAIYLQQLIQSSRQKP